MVGAYPLEIIVSIVELRRLVFFLVVVNSISMASLLLYTSATFDRGMQMSSSMLTSSCVGDTTGHLARFFHGDVSAFSFSFFLDPKTILMRTALMLVFLNLLFLILS